MTNAGKPASRRGARNDERWETGLAQRGLRITGDEGWLQASFGRSTAVAFSVIASRRAAKQSTEWQREIACILDLNINNLE